ncbi:integrase [Terribacillus saccharophilus]|uniref:integrase n=1 Tax=Terribacillus saccharophilus TaxID=361277 RepID=UPI003982BA52
MSNTKNKVKKSLQINTDIESFKLQLKLKSHQYGNFQFEDDKWYCNKKHKSSSEKSSYTIVFSFITEEFRVWVKYYSLMSNNSIPVIKEKVGNINHFLIFFREEFPSLPLSRINRRIIDYYEKKLREQRSYSENVKMRKYAVLKEFFSLMSAFPEFPDRLAIKTKNPFRVEIISDPNKYIPPEVVKQFDRIMKDEKHEIPDVYRLAYWLQRSFPNRITEVTSIPINCLKSLYNMYVINIPTTKQSGGYITEEIKTIPIINSGHGKYIVELIKKVQRQTQKLLENHSIEERYSNFLFLSLVFKLTIKNGRIKSYIPGDIYQKIIEYQQRFPEDTPKQISEKMNQVGYSIHDYTIRDRLRKGLTKRFDQLMPFPSTRFNNVLNRIAVLCNVTDSDGEIYKITSHQFRHNATTDRLYIGGYTMDQILAIRNDKGTAMPMNYVHQQKEMHKKMWMESTGLKSPEKAPVEFKGRIFNLDDSKVLERLNKDPRMYLTWEANSKKGVGLCSMISGCKPDGTSIHFECYECNWFVPKAEYYEDYKKELTYWRGIMNDTTGQPKRAASNENAIRNVNCLERIIQICDIGVDKYKRNIKQKLQLRSDTVE